MTSVTICSSLYHTMFEQSFDLVLFLSLSISMLSILRLIDFFSCLFEEDWVSVR